jgi:predicted TIM-barrel fold metal-dependent hydrolase
MNEQLSMMDGPPLIDSDVHHQWASNDDVLAYLPRRWHDLLLEPTRSSFAMSPPTIWVPHTHGTNSRIDAFGPNGIPPASDYETMRRQYLDPFNVGKAVLSFNIGLNGGLHNPYLAKELVRALNDWNRDHWLSIDDDRLASVIVVPSQDPGEAAKEIRRVAGHPKIVEILLVHNAFNRPFGHPVYHPIYEASEEVGLPVGIHPGGEIWGGGAQPAAGGMPNSRLEYHTLVPQTMMHHGLSFVTHGVFEKFKGLKVLLIEAGVSWLPWLLWRMDAMYDELRCESDWVKRLPSEYFCEHIRLTTQPLEASPKPRQMVEWLEAIDGVQDILCYASDYPHWDTDDPRIVVNRLPRKWRTKLFHNNAARLYGWPEIPETASVELKEMGRTGAQAGGAIH